MIVFAMNRLNYEEEIVYAFFEKMDDFSSQLGIRKYSEIRHFSMKFPSEGEFWHCHFTGYKMGVSNQMFQSK